MKGNFQIILVIVFIAAAIVGVLIFSGAIPIGSTTNTVGGTVVLWGTMRATAMTSALEGFNTANQNFVVQYVEKSPETFDQDLLEALASGTGPDLFLLPDNLAYHYSNKLFVIPYDSYPLTSFKNTFASAGDVFLTSSGVLALPMTVDPLVLYYNRGMLNSSAVVYPPSTWDELPSFVSLVNKKDNSNKITKSAIALGHFSNIAHAKDILTTLFMQAGSPVIAEKDGVFHSYLSSQDSKYDLSSVLKFYTDFAAPSSNVYSWNKSFASSTSAFSSEDLALYFGYASELQPLVNRNPNQDFLATSMPQIRGAAGKITNARVTGLAISSSSKNFNTAFTAASLMATGDFASKLSLALGIPPARRDLLSIKPKDAYFPVFYNSALFAKSWLDPSPTDSDNIFRTMIDGVLSNSMTPRDAISDASAKLDLLLLK